MTASAFGIDFGNESSVIAYAGKGHIDIAINEISKRKTPSIVSYFNNQRKIGESGLSSQNSNIKHTITEIKRLLGRNADENELQIDAQTFNYQINRLSQNGANDLISVNIGKSNFLPEQITASLFNHFKKIAKNSTKQSIYDCVISCPPYFTHKQRKALKDAAKIAGINVLRIMNETTAVALDYGIMRSLPKKEPIKVLFFDIGHSSVNATLVSFLEKELSVLAHASDRFLGGRDFDRVLAHYFAQEIHQKYGIDVFSNPKCSLRLFSAAKKTKLVLSANQDAPFYIECLKDDIDVNLHIKREKFIQLSQHLINRCVIPLKKVLQMSQNDIKDVFSIEIVGGGVRIPAIRKKIVSVFNKQLSTTCNGDESVARGCALQCAMLSPAFKVRQFDVKDISNYPIEICWGQISDDFMSDNCQFEERYELFSRFNPIPSAKLISIVKNEPFQIVIRYLSSEKELGKGTKAFISRYIIRPPQINKESIGTPKIKVKIALDISGMVVLRRVEFVEELKAEIIMEKSKEESDLKGNKKNENDKEEEEEEKENEDLEMVDKETAAETTTADKETTATEKTTDVDTEKQETTEKEAMDISSDKEKKKEEEVKEKKPKKPKKKKRFLRTQINVEETICGFNEESFKHAFECEAQMEYNDKIIEERDHYRNELESYIYDMRSNLSFNLKPFIEEKNAETFLMQLNETENWLYTDEGHLSPKKEFINRINTLKSIGNPIIMRKFEYENRDLVINNLNSAMKTFKTFLNQANSGDKKYNHIEKEELTKLSEKLIICEKWICEMIEKQKNMNLFIDPILKVNEIKDKESELTNLFLPVINRPKPEPKKETKKETKDKKKDKNKKEEKGEANLCENESESSEKVDLNGCEKEENKKMDVE